MCRTLYYICQKIIQFSFPNFLRIWYQRYCLKFEVVSKTQQLEAGTDWSIELAVSIRAYHIKLLFRETLFRIVTNLVKLLFTSFYQLRTTWDFFVSIKRTCNFKRFYPCFFQNIPPSYLSNDLTSNLKGTCITCQRMNDLS